MRWNASVGLLVVVPVVALATSITPHTLAARAQEADRVVLVQVLASQTVLENGDPRRMKTITDLVIGQSFKGAGPDRVQVIQLGGSSGLWESHVPGDARLEVGEMALLFLKCTELTRCYLVALGAGALRMVDGQLLVPDLQTDTFSKQSLKAVVAQLQPVPSRVEGPLDVARDRPAKGAR